MKRQFLFVLALGVCFRCSLASEPLDTKGPPASIPQSSTPLSVEDRTQFHEAMNLINLSDDHGDHLQRAYKILMDLAQRNPTSGYPVAGFAELQYRLATIRKSSYAEAVRLARRAIRMDPKVAEAYVVLAKAMLNQKDVLGAERAAESAIRLAPDMPEVLFSKARVEEATRKYEDAERSFRRAIERLTDNRRKSNVYFWLGEMFKNKTPPDIPGAIAAYEKSAELDPESPSKLNNIASFFMNYTDRYDQAIEYLNRAQALRESNAVRTNLGLVRYARWAHNYLHPDKRKQSRSNPDNPKTITAETGVTPEYVFVKDSIARATPRWATIALLKAGMIQNIDVIPPGTEGTALSAAAYGNHFEIVKMLADRGANVNAEDPGDKKTAIFHAATNGNLQIVKYLFEKGARINVTDVNGTPLLFYTLGRDDEPEDARILKFLLEQGADATVLDRFGNSLIVAAVRMSRPDAVRTLIEKYHADPNAKSSQGRPILSTAATVSGTNGKEIVRFLLEAGANPWVKYGSGDVLVTLHRKDINPKIFPSYSENASMLENARKKVPRPADFGKAHPEPQ